MHFAGIIIKDKSIDVSLGRATLGEILVERGLSDWYSTDDYRERTFDGKQEITLEEFKVVWEEWKKDGYGQTALILIEDIDDEPEVIDIYTPYTFYEFEKHYREKLVALCNEAYFSSVDNFMNDLDKDKYNVCLLDYHN